jgi:hypothetical protein
MAEDGWHNTTKIEAGTAIWSVWLWWCSRHPADWQRSCGKHMMIRRALLGFDGMKLLQSYGQYMDRP